MADHTLIADVSEALVAQLQPALDEVLPGVAVVVDRLDGTFDKPTVSLFLYQIHEDDTVLRSRSRRSAGRPPLALSLSYLITAWSDSATDDQRLIGTVVRLFHDHPLLQGLLGDHDGESAARVTLEPLSLEHKTRMWESLRQPYRLSVAYTLRVATPEV